MIHHSDGSQYSSSTSLTLYAATVVDPGLNYAAIPPGMVAPLSPVILLYMYGNNGGIARPSHFVVANIHFTSRIYGYD